MKSEALLADNSALKVDLADALTLKDELQRDMATIKTAMTEQSEQLAAATNGLSVVQQELAATKEQLAQETQRHLDVKGALDASTARTGELEATVEALRSALSRCNTDNTTLKEKHNEGLAIIEQLKEQLKEARNELSTLRQDNKEYRAENKSLRASVSELLSHRGVDIGDGKILQDFSAGDGNIGGRHTHHGCIQPIKRRFVHPDHDLVDKAGVFIGLCHAYKTTGLLDRGHNCVHV